MVTEESTKETVKTIARGMPGFSGEPVVTTLVCLLHILHARLWVHWAPGIPCALCFLWADGFCKNSDASRREIADAYLQLPQEWMICAASV